MRIGVIGPIGSGKSTLSKLLAEHYKVPMVNEPVENNEFLPLFYEDKKTFALLSQNAFYSSLFLLMWNSKDVKQCIFDSTLFSNLVFTELLRLEGIMSAYEVALTYAIADEHLKRLPDVDIHLVLVREEDQLFENVRKRGREMEKDQFEYLKFHYKNYYDVLDRIFKNYQVPEEKILYLPLNDIFVPEKNKYVPGIIRKEKNISCVYFSAFDEPWKDPNEPKASENNFGLFTVDGKAKFALWPLVGRGVFDGLSREENGMPVGKTYDGNKSAIWATISEINY